jgi:hypothetical protein
MIKIPQKTKNQNNMVAISMEKKDLKIFHLTYLNKILLFDINKLHFRSKRKIYKALSNKIVVLKVNLRLRLLPKKKKKRFKSVKLVFFRLLDFLKIIKISYFVSKKYAWLRNLLAPLPTKFKINI